MRDSLQRTPSCALLKVAPLPPCHVPCSLANLGKKAAEEGWGIPAFEEHRDTHLFTRR